MTRNAHGNTQTSSYTTFATDVPSEWLLHDNAFYIASDGRAKYTQWFVTNKFESTQYNGCETQPTGP